jgi:trimeric autotransporter adhesin
MATDVDRATALNLSTDLAQAGAVFNDSTRLADGGLWKTPADNNNQAAYLGMYTTDIHAVLADVNAALASPTNVTVGGTAYALTSADTAVLQQVQGQLQTLLDAAPASAGHGNHATAAQNLIHTTQTSILNEINGDGALAQALAGNSYQAGGAANVGFQNLPAGSDSAAALAATMAPGVSFAQIGTVFNAAADLAVGGVNHSNLGQFNADLKAISTGLSNLVNSPTQLAALEAGETPQNAALTTVHLDTMLNQINLQLSTFNHQFNSNHTLATRGTNDNLLDIIDIAQGDTTLAAAANNGGAAGFAPLPSYLTGTIQHYQDNQAQTNFWAQFLSEANVIGGQLNNVAAGNNASPAEVQSLITEIQNYQQFGASFANSQGGVFSARFNNELTGGTLLADTQNAVQGLKGIANGDTGAKLAADQAQIQAAGQGFIADAQDVSGNNTPIGGGTYVGTATTVSGATSPAGVAQGTIPVTGTASGSTGLAGGSGGNGAGAGTGNAGDGQPGTDHGIGQGFDVAGAGHIIFSDLQSQFQHFWHHG